MVYKGFTCVTLVPMSQPSIVDVVLSSSAIVATSSPVEISASYVAMDRVKAMGVTSPVSPESSESPETSGAATSFSATKPDAMRISLLASPP